MGIAGLEHLKILKRGVEVWNKWALLISTNIIEPNLKGASLGGADLYRANLIGANLIGANLIGANLIGANLIGANLYFAKLKDATLERANLERANLERANLERANLERANLERANLSGANLSGANLEDATLDNATLTDANLSCINAINTNFQGAILTGVCIEDWHITADTNLQDVVCDYIFMGYEREGIKPHYTDRRPHDPTKTFVPGDFAKLVQKSLDTVDLIFREGLDWRAFAYSFNQLEIQYGNDQLAINTIENQGNGTVIVRLATAPTLDKEEVDQTFWRGFEMAQQALSGQYEARIADKDRHINQLFQLLQHSQEKLGEVPKLMSEQSKYDLRGSKFAGGFAAEAGVQVGGTFNDYSTTITNSLDEITSLIQSLQQLAQSFPTPQRDEVDEHLNDLKEDLKQPEKIKPSRLKATLGALLAIAIGLGGAVATATDFANNVLELSNKFGIELMHPQQNQSSSPSQSLNPSFSLPASALPTDVDGDVIDPKP